MSWNGIAWTPTPNSFTAPAGGDLSGHYPNPFVAALQGVPINPVAPIAGQVLYFDGAKWKPGSFNTFQSAYNCPSTVSVNDAVYSNGSNSVDRAKADSISTMPALGFVLSKPTSTTAVIQYYGEIGGFIGLTPGVTYYVSDSVIGGITSTVPVAIGSTVQKVGFAKNSTTMVSVATREAVTL